MKRAIAGGVLAFLSIAMLLLIYGEVFAPVTRMYFGVALEPHGSDAVVARVDKKSAAYKAGVRDGDIVPIMAMPLASRLRLQINMSPAGTRITLPVERSGVRREMELVAQEYPAKPFSFGTFTLLANATVTLLIVAMIALRRPSIATAALVLYGMGACTTFAIAGQFSWLPDALFAPVTVVIIAAFSGLPILALLPFIVRFPESPATPQGRLRLRIADAVFLIGAVLSVVQVLQEPIIFATWYDFDVWSSTVFMAIVLVFTVSVYREARGEARRRIDWVIAGMVLSAIGYTGFNIAITTAISSSTAQGTLRLVEGICQLLQSALPIALAYAVLRHRVLDISFALNRTMVYGVMTALVVIVVSLIDWGTSRMLSEQRWALAIEAIVTIGFGFALNWIHARTERLIDRIVFRARHLAEKRIESRIAALAFATSSVAVDEALAIEGPRILHLRSGAIFTRIAAGAPFTRKAAFGWEEAPLEALSDDELIVRTLRSIEKPIILDDLAIPLSGGPGGEFRPVVAVPLVAQHELIGLALYGNGHDGAIADPEEISLLAQLCAAGATTYGAVDARQWRERVLALERSFASGTAGA